MLIADSPPFIYIHVDKAAGTQNEKSVAATKCNIPSSPTSKADYW
jgi:hypothetical protein